MQKLVAILVFAAATASAAPQVSFAQTSQQSQTTTSIQQRVKNNLEQAGFKNVQVMPSSFLVRATDKDGNPVMMVINPDSVTAVEMSGRQQSSQGSATGSAAGTGTRSGTAQTGPTTGVGGSKK